MFNIKLILLQLSNSTQTKFAEGEAHDTETDIAE